MTKDLKLKIYPAVIGVLGICLVVSLLFNIDIQIEREVPPTGRAPNPDLDRPLPEPDEATASPTIPPDAALAPDVEAPFVTPSVAPLPANTDIQGKLRLSNQTEYPLRVALLHRQTALSNTASNIDGAGFKEPVHWDFAPGEGRAKGLILSLPEDNLQLQTGDVLVAFAQDGSRRYWGPYVVGETPLPIWNATTEEWQLILQP